MTTLTNEEKVSVIDNRIKSLEYNKYNLQLGLIEENAVTNKNQGSIDSITEQISSVNTKISALQAEKTSLTE